MSRFGLPRLSIRSSSGTTGAAGTVASAALGAGLIAALLSGPAGASTMPLLADRNTPASDTVRVTGSAVTVTMHGNGHGHGMSQYGAEGAALQGLSYRKIVGFYYPGATLQTMKWSTIRIRLSGVGTNLQVAATPGLFVTGVAGPLPTAGVVRYRLLSNSGTGTRLQQLLAPTKSAPKPAWHTILDGLPDGAAFHRTGFTPMRVFQPDGSSVAYAGWLRAWRTDPSGYGHGTYVVNQVSLDKYTAGVVPREMPASWARAATDAQAVAARTYGEYAVEHPLARTYDICDTTSCQVYGGSAAYYADGSLRWTNLWQAAADTARQVLTFHGSTIFAQFSASNGGWTVDGGQPYLVARQDPYDDRASGDPYLSYSQTVPVSQIAGYFGLAKITRFAITKRDGHGAGGGRALAVLITGRTGSGSIRVVSATGFELAAAVGAGTTWLSLRNG